MRYPALLLLLTFLLTGCANEGTVVRKEFRPLPAYLTYGLEGTYNLTLRTADGRLVSQMVTPWVFERYVVGDYFNDLQPRASSITEEPKLMRQVSASRTAQADRVASHRRGNRRVSQVRIARTNKSEKRPLMVERAVRRKIAVAAARPRLAAPSAKVAQVSRLPARTSSKAVVRLSTPLVADNDYTIVQVVRCR